MNESGQPKPVQIRKKLKRHFIVWVLLIALGLLLLGEIIGSIIVGILMALVPMSDGVTFAVEFYLSFIGIDAAVLLYCGLAEKEVFRSFTHASKGGGKGNTWKFFGFGILAGFLTNALCILAAYLHGDLHFSVGRFDVLYMLLAFLVVLIQSGAEELLTRGYIFSAIKQRYGVWVGLAANALLFGALHLLNNGVTVLSIINIVFYGAALSLVMIYTDSLWFCIAMHTAWNFTQNFLFGLPNSGLVSKQSFLHLEAAAESIVYDPVFGVEGAIGTTVVLIVLSVLVLFSARKRRGNINP